VARLVIVLEVEANPELDGPAYVADAILLRTEDLHESVTYPTFVGRPVRVTEARWAGDDAPA
jgi:hypothetical protein